MAGRAIPKDPVLGDLRDRRSPKIVELALNGHAWNEIARKLRIDTRTLYTIRESEGLDALVAQLAQEQLQAHLRRLVRMGDGAVRVVERALAGKKVGRGQWEAAKHVTTHVYKLAAIAAKLREAGEPTSTADAAVERQKALAERIPYAELERVIDAEASDTKH